jgi:hypothetical protein
MPTKVRAKLCVPAQCHRRSSPGKTTAGFQEILLLDQQMAALHKRMANSGCI